MKYRLIAKKYVLEHGVRRPVQADDGQNIYDEAPKDFTPKQLGKVQAAVNDLAKSLEKKWLD